MGVQVVWVYGPSGVGKSATCWELYSQLEACRVRAGYVDIDQLGMCYPARAEDPYREELKATNIGAVLQNFAAAGAELVIVSGILDPRLLPVYHEGAVGCRIEFCRLRAGHRELLRRLEKRDREGDSNNIFREAEELDALDLGHHVVETDGLALEQVARRVGEKSGFWADFGERPGRLSTSRSTAGVDSPGVTAVSRPTDLRPSQAPGRVLWFCGPAGAGKSTVGYAVFQQVGRAGRVAGFVDLEQLGFFRGNGFFREGEAVDSGNHRLKAANVGDLWSSFHSAGATDLIMVGAVDDAADVRLYRDALAAANLTLYRLLLPSAGELAERMRRRADGQGPDIAGDRLRNQPPGVQTEVLKQALADDAVLDRAGIGDFSVPTEGRAVADIAREALSWSP